MKTIYTILIVLSVNFLMTKEEFKKSNGFPGVCTEVSFPLLKSESCTRNNESYLYFNNHLVSWSKSDNVY